MTSADILLERVGATRVTNLTARAGNALFAMRDGGWVPLWQEGGVGEKTIRYLLAFGLVERQWRTRSLVYDFYRLTPAGRFRGFMGRVMGLYYNYEFKNSRWPEKKRRFLEALRECGNIRIACEVAGIERRSAYVRRM